MPRVNSGGEGSCLEPLQKAGTRREPQYADVDKIQGALEKHIVTVHSVKWNGQAQMPEKQLAPMAAMLRDLRKLRENLSFNRKAVKQALKRLAEEKEFTLHLGDEKESWSESVSQQLVNCCQWVRSSSQKAAARGVQTQLLSKIFADDSEKMMEDGGAGAATSGGEPRERKRQAATSRKTKAVTEWDYDFDMELMAGFRVPKGQQKPQEIAKTTQPEEGASRLESPVATFKDGTKMTINGYTNEEFASMLANRGKSKGFPFDESKGSLRLRLEHTGKNCTDVLTRNVLLTSFNKKDRKWSTVCQYLHTEKEAPEVMQFMKGLCQKILNKTLDEPNAKALKEADSRLRARGRNKAEQQDERTRTRERKTPTKRHGAATSGERTNQVTGQKRKRQQSKELGGTNKEQKKSTKVS